jgi:glutathione S-transferase
MFELKLKKEYKMSTVTLYRHALSGHAHRVETFLSILNLPANIIDVDLANGAHKLPEFLQKNRFGQVPVLEDGDITLADSNAILVYLAAKYDKKDIWLPKAPAVAAEVQRFLSVAAGKVAFGPAVARLVNVFGAQLDHDSAIAIAHGIIAELDSHLEGRQWLVTDHATIADLANYAYIAHAPEGDVSLVDYANVRAWLTRIEQLPGFVPMQATAVGLATKAA